MDRVIQWWTKGPYSHVELVTEHGAGWSSSQLDGGIREKHNIDFSSGRWDVIEVPGLDLDTAVDWFILHSECSYDIIGLIGFLCRPASHSPTRFFCSEAVAAALGIPEPWRYDPNTLYSAVQWWKNTDVVTPSVFNDQPF